MIELMNDSNSAINTAAPKLEKAKFCSPTITDVNFSIIPLMIKLNNPNVINVMGRDNTCKIGLTKIFKADKTKLATIAITKLFT